MNDLRKPTGVKVSVKKIQNFRRSHDKITGYIMAYDRNGTLRYAKSPDGSVTSYNDHGNVIYDKLPNGSLSRYNNNGIMIYRKFPDGKIYTR